MSIFFTSDEHHGHANVIKFCNRPFANIDEMTEALIDRHNSVVKPGDLVYHLGDMFWRTFGTEDAINVMKRLRGNHYYILGNHEEIMESNHPQTAALWDRFIWVKELTKISPPPNGSPKIVLCHYAMRVWEHSHKGSWQLYGHSHGELSKGVPTKDDSLLSLDVGVDCWDYYPVSLEQVTEVMDKKKT